MQTKLTLRMDKRLIDKAKRFATEHERSVSQLVADYFACLEPPSAARTPDSAEELPELVRRLRGALRGASVDEGDYQAYLENKHL